MRHQGAVYGVASTPQYSRTSNIVIIIIPGTGGGTSREGIVSHKCADSLNKIGGVHAGIAALTHSSLELNFLCSGRFLRKKKNEPNIQIKNRSKTQRM